MPLPSFDPRALERGFPCNVRDLGGLPTSGGGAVRSGVLFRGDDPGRGDAAAGDRLIREFGIRHLIDLRLASEVGDATSTFRSTPGITHHWFPVTLADALGPRGVPHTVAELAEVYARAVEVWAGTLVEALRRVAELEEPVLVHCSHGKDRTGVVIALIMAALEVDRQAVVTDFARTAENLPLMHELARRQGISLGVENIPEVFRLAPAEAMSHCLDLLDEWYGGPLAPLFAAGLDPATVAALRAKYLASGA
ncbi:tyrosine-protein phosphatase [Nocardia carnea]|uniref:tyrosine-protein phosphatase n=1 Tax=Nocardia carnea TaxID=37328 RepID=UPI0024581CF9|nr:tyrosine-protein phosphatase [Nocardia carnea]